jgi:hypothetical protein
LYEGSTAATHATICSSDCQGRNEQGNRYIKDPNEAVKTGQIVKVKVLSADAKTKRIVLSMKALMEAVP